MDNKVTESNYSSADESNDNATIEQSKQFGGCSSNYCKWTSSAKQMEFIREILIQENNGDSKIIMNKADRGVTHQRKYLIDAKWWRNWCDYTGFN